MIAQRIHHEKEVSKLNDEVRDLRRRVNEQVPLCRISSFYSSHPHL